MSILIRDMEMPASCPCELIGYGYDVYCSFAGGVPARIKEYYECCENGTRPSWCPLVTVPPHGDLIDRDAFVKELEYSIELEQRALDDMECTGKDRELLLLDRICRQNSIHYLSEASIIIPANKEGKT